MKAVKLKSTAPYPVEVPGLNRTVDPDEVFVVDEKIVEEFNLLKGRYEKVEEKVKKEKEAKK